MGGGEAEDVAEDVEPQVLGRAHGGGPPGSGDGEGRPDPAQGIVALDGDTHGIKPTQLGEVGEVGLQAPAGGVDQEGVAPEGRREAPGSRGGQGGVQDGDGREMGKRRKQLDEGRGAPWEGPAEHQRGGGGAGIAVEGQ